MLSTLTRICQGDKEFFRVNFSVDKISDYNLFYSWRMLQYILFNKFFLKYRKPKLSDINDLHMSSCFPYVDAVILEKEMAETLRQIQKKYNFIQHLEIMTIKDFRE